MTTKKNMPHPYFAIRITDGGPIQENFSTRKKAKDAAAKHFLESHQHTVIGKVGAKSFTVLGNAIIDPTAFINILNESKLQSYENIDALANTHYAYCRDERKRIGVRTSREQAQQNADAHYRATGGPDGGHHTVVESYYKV